MLPLQILKDSRSATSLQASADGVLPCASQECLTLSAAGQAHPLASHSAQQESNSDSLTIATLPQHLYASSLSAALQCSLENRLRQQLQSTGSMIYSMSWKQKHTPAGRQYCQRVASVPRTSETGCFLVPAHWHTPTTNVNNQPETARGLQTLAGQAKHLAGWLSPCAQNGTVNGYTDWMKIIKRKEAGRQQNLQDVVVLAAWTTPSHSDGTRGGTGITANMTGSSLAQLVKMSGPIRLTACGQMRTGSDAGMENSGRLNPAHSRWMMGFPPEWDACAVMETP